MHIRKYKGGLIERLDCNESEELGGKRYHVTFPLGFVNGHGATVSYEFTLADSKEAIRYSTPN